MPSLLSPSDPAPTMTTTDPSTTMTTTGPLSNPSRPALPKAFTYTVPAPLLCYQGAEALLYRTYFPLVPPPSSPLDTASSSSSTNTATPSNATNPQTPRTLPAALKHRPSKPYRHPLLDAKLTRHRLLSEARALIRLRRDGVAQVPAVYALDWEQGWMLFEWVEGETVRAVLDREVPKMELGDEEAGGRLETLMGRVGEVVARVHERGVCHGDLTTSNLMVRRRQDTHQGEEEREGDVVLIDFGLAAQGTQDEDRAVDLYVLERAFGSTHPRTEGLWKEVLRAYGEGYKGAKGVVKRLEEVRMRGRKKIMIG